jgi:acyl carrier protein
MIQTSASENEFQDKLIDILYDNKAISLEMNREEFNPKISLINDLKLDSIQLLEYLLAIEFNLEINLDYEDLEIDLFDDFNKFSNYLYHKAAGQSGGENDE